MRQRQLAALDGPVAVEQQVEVEAARRVRIRALAPGFGLDRLQRVQQLERRGGSAQPGDGIEESPPPASSGADS
jgi:hypothetical protein